MPERLKTQKKLVGFKQVRRALQAGRVRVLYLAKDADPAMTDALCALAGAQGAETVWLGTMAKLGAACAISVGAACAAVTD